MIKIIKKYIRKTLETFGIEVRIKPKFSKVMNYDDIYRSKILDDKLIKNWMVKNNGIPTVMGLRRKYSGQWFTI